MTSSCLISPSSSGAKQIRHRRSNRMSDSQHKKVHEAMSCNFLNRIFIPLTKYFYYYYRKSTERFPITRNTLDSVPRRDIVTWNFIFRVVAAVASRAHFFKCLTFFCVFVCNYKVTTNSSTMRPMSFNAKTWLKFDDGTNLVHDYWSHFSTSLLKSSLK